jgi:hypothetical protein
MERRGSHLARLGAVIGLVALVAGVRALPAGAVAPSLTLPPERLYTLVDTPIAFTGADPISGDDRALALTTTDDGCAPADGNDWSLDGCARVQLDVAHGELAVPLQTTLGGVGEPDGIATGGAIVDGSTNGDGTGLVVNLNGTQDQLNDALAVLTYTPDSGYEYDGTNPEALDVLVADGTTPADNTSHSVEIFVQQLNDWPDLTVPSEAAVAAGGTVSLPAVEPPVGTNGDLYVEDADITDGEADDEMLFVMVASCGEFSLRGGALTFGQTIEDLLTSEGVPDLAIAAILAALPSEVTSQMFATGSPTDWREGLAAVAEYDELNYALSQVDFQAPATDGTCDLWTIVTDLGNNGLPVQYVGSPLGGRDQPQPGVEIPALGVDLGITSFVVGEGVELTLPTNLAIGEGSTLPIPGGHLDRRPPRGRAHRHGRRRHRHRRRGRLHGARRHGHLPRGRRRPAEPRPAHHGRPRRRARRDPHGHRRPGRRAAGHHPGERHRHRHDRRRRRPGAGHHRPDGHDRAGRRPGRPDPRPPRSPSTSSSASRSPASPPATSTCRPRPPAAPWSSATSPGRAPATPSRSRA